MEYMFDGWISRWNICKMVGFPDGIYVKWLDFQMEYMLIMVGFPDGIYVK